MDLFNEQPVPIEEKIAHLNREIAMRRSVYPRWVAKGKMKQDQADRGIAVMQAILADYERQKESQ